MSPAPEFTETAKLRIKLYGFTTTDWWDHLTDSLEELQAEEARRNMRECARNGRI